MKPTHRNPLLRNFVLAATICLTFGQAANAGSVYWDTNSTTAGSGAATGTWGTDTFWTTTEAGNVATTGTLPTANDDVFIAAGTTGTTGTITISGAQVAGSVTIQEPAANPGVTISGGTSLTLGGGSSVSKGLFVTGNGAHTVSTPLILSGANTIQNAGNLTLAINGGITGTGDLTLRNNSSGATGINVATQPINITGAISNTGSSTGTVVIGNANAAPGVGSGGLGANVTSVSQDSTTSPLQLLNAVNSSYTGNYNINAGTLQLAGTNTTGTITATNSASVINLGATSGTNAATLNIVNNAVSGKVNNNINVRAGSTGTKSMTINSNVSFATTGTVTLDDNLTVTPNTANFGYTFNGVVQDGSSGAKGLIKAGAGDVTLTLANTYSGATSVTAGNLILSGSAGALPNTSGVTISGGTFRLNNTAAANNTDRIPDSKVISINGGTLNFNHNAGAANYSETVAVNASSSGTISTSQAAVDQTSTLTIGTSTRSPGGALIFSGTGLGVDNRNRIFFTTSPAVNDVIPWATFGTTGFAGYDPADGVYAYNGASDIDALGSTIINDSTSNLRIINDGTGSPIALGSTVTSVNTLVQANTTLGSTPTIDTAGKTLRMNALLIPSTTNTRGLTIGAAADDGTLTAGTAGGELFLNNYSANPLILNAVIADNTSPSSVSKAGSGSATFAVANTHSGGTNISGGIVTAANAAALGSGTVTINPGATRLVINDGLTLANNITFKGGGAASRGVFENSSTGEATLGGTITIDGPLSGGGHFASATGGTLKVTGAINSASQPVTARLGTVIFSGGGSYSSFILNEGTLKLGANNGMSTSATVDLAASSTGVLDLNGYNQTLVGITRTANQTATIGNGSDANDSTLTTTGTSTYAGNITNVIGTPATPKTTSLVVNSGNLTLTGGFTAENISINNTGTLTIGGGGGDGINPVSKLITVNSGGTLKFTGTNRVQNNTVIDVKSGATFDENGQTDVVGHITGAGSITNVNNSLILALPAIGSPAEFSGTINGTSTTASALVLRCDGTGASAASTLILSGDNTGLTATGLNSSVNVQGGRLIGRNTAAFGPAGQIITVGASALTLDPTIEFGNNTPMNSYVINIGSGNTGTIELNRATPGAALTQPAGNATLGNATLNIEKGANVTSGTPVLQFSSIALSAGSGTAVTINPVDVDISVVGGITRPGVAAGNLRLDGTSTGNIISGDIQDNGANKLNVTKSNASIWTLGAANTYTGNTSITGGILALGASGSIDNSPALSISAGAKLDTTAKATYTMPATQTVTFTVDATGAGSSGQINAAGLDISNANVVFTPVGTLDDAVYVLATYTSKTGASFLTGSAPSGYSIDYAYNGGTQIALVQSAGYSSWAGTYAGSQAANLDFDNDGVDNGIEYFLNATTAGFTASPSSFTGNTATWTNGGNIPFGDYGTQFYIQTSPDLVNWTKVLAGDTNLNNQAGSVAYTLTGTGKQFVRLVVTPN